MKDEMLTLTAEWDKTFPKSDGESGRQPDKKNDRK